MSTYRQCSNEGPWTAADIEVTLKSDHRILESLELDMVPLRLHSRSLVIHGIVIADWKALVIEFSHIFHECQNLRLKDMVAIGQR